MSLNAMGMGMVFTVRDLASGHLARIQRSFMSLDERVTGGRDRLQKAFSQIGTGTTLLTAGVVPLAGAFGLANAAGAFERSVAAVGAVAKASAKDMDALKDAALKAGIATQFTPTEAALGLGELAQAGFSAQQSVSLLIPTLDLAAGSLGKLSPQDAAGLAAQTLKSFGLEAHQAGFAVDQLLQAVNVFALNAGELPLGLGHIANASRTMNQGLGESLIALGLVKNIIPGIERASTAAAVAMERLADPHTQALLAGKGVKVDVKGQFRPFLDILNDLAPALDRMNEKARAAFLLKAFGREALGGVSAILSQIGDGLQTDAGAIVRGAEAIKYLRGQFDHAGGAAAAFRDKLLDTYEGQKLLLRGSLETLSIVAGDAFAKAFKPMVTTVIEGINTVIRIVQATPEPVKRAFAAFVLGASTLLALVGGAIAAKASLALLAIGMKVVGVTFAGVAATLAAGIAIVALVGLAFAGLRVAYEKNVGGIADRLRGFGAAVSLIFQSLEQIVEKGGLYGAVRAEFFRIENDGVRRFVVQVGMLVFRLQKLWRGITIGFEQGIEAASPAFEALSAAFRSVSAQFGELLATVMGSGTELKSDKFLFFGHSVGEAFAFIVKTGTRVATWLLQFGSGVLSGIRTSFKWFGGALGFVGKVLSDFGNTWDELWGGGSSKDTERAALGFADLGRVAAKVAGAILTGLVYAFGLLVRVIRLNLPLLRLIWAVISALGSVILFFGELAWEVFTETIPDAVETVWTVFADLFQGTNTWFDDIGEGITTFFENIVDGAERVVDAVADFFTGLVKRIAGAFAWIGKGARALLGVIPDELLPSGLQTLKITPGAAPAVTPIPPTGVQPLAAPLAFGPSATEARARASDSAGLATALAARTPGNVAALPPFVVELKVDGETLARASHKAGANIATRSLSPLPTY